MTSTHGTLRYAKVSNETTGGSKGDLEWVQKRPTVGVQETNYLGIPELLVSAATRQRLTGEKILPVSALAYLLHKIK